MSNVCLIDFAEDELEAFLSGRSDGIPTSPENGLQLLAGVATATADTKGSLPCHDVQVEFRPGLTGSDRVPTGPRPGTSRVKAGSEPGLGREFPWDQRPGFTGSGRAPTGLEPGESRVKAGCCPGTPETQELALLVWAWTGPRGGMPSTDGSGRSASTCKGGKGRSRISSAAISLIKFGWRFRLGPGEPQLSEWAACELFQEESSGRMLF